MAAIVNQEQQRVAVGPGSGHFISVRQVSYDAATMQRDTCGHAAQWPRGDAFTPPAPQLLMLLHVGKLVIYNSLLLT